jgi:5-bromo-4-chloroindolyl phosphate hydrolysis protein
VSEYLQIEKQSAKAQETVANLSQCLALLPEVSSHLLSALRTLYLIPLELGRLEAREGYAREHQRALESFVRHHYKSEEEASR